MIKAIIFDWGNVLDIIKREEFWENRAKKYGISTEEFGKAEHELRKRMDAGEIGKKESSYYYQRK